MARGAAGQDGLTSPRPRLRKVRPGWANLGGPSPLLGTNKRKNCGSSSGNF